MLALVFAGLALFTVRASAPWDLLDNDQIRPAAYALDVVVHGNWIIQTDFKGDIASKPPVYTWLVALLAFAVGGVNKLSLYLPCGLAITGTSLLAAWLAGRRFGARAGLLAGLAILLCPLGLKHMALARTDAVFALTTGLAGVMGLLALEGKQRWVWFYLACALATLTKGPLGAVLGGAGLLAMVWERGSGSKRDTPGGHPLGIAVFLAFTVGWFYLAYMQVGERLIDKMIGRELVGHAVRSDDGSDVPGVSLAVPTLYFLARFAPWSMPAVFGIVRAFRARDADDEQRRCTRYLVCWFLVGLVIFSIAPHQRADHLMPILLPAAVLGGREAARWIEAWSDRKLAWGAWIAVGVAVMGGFFWYHVQRRGDPKIVRLGVAQRLAQEISSIEHAHSRLVFTPGTSVMQVLWGTKKHRRTAEEAVDLLAEDRSKLIVVRDPAPLLRASEERGLELMRIDAIVDIDPAYSWYKLKPDATN